MSDGTQEVIHLLTFQVTPPIRHRYRRADRQTTYGGNTGLCTFALRASRGKSQMHAYNDNLRVRTAHHKYIASHPFVHLLSDQCNA